ncbi:MAG: rRNA maturation RNase YbeY [Solobacterium sp.]|nr:rRNA maturation RNase YbeY [Solobacterium sp.]
MELQLLNRTNENVYIFKPLFLKIAKAAEKRLNLKRNYEISVTFVRSRTIHSINLQYRNIDRPTDVISFAIQDEYNAFFDYDDLGDIFINIDYARKQAKEYKHSYEREIAFLFTHGLLHCLGYDHMNEEEEKIMYGLQKEILDPIIER